MSPEPSVRGSGFLPFCWITLRVTTVSLDEPKPNGFSTTPTPTVLFWVTTFLRILTLWPPTLRIPTPEGSSCRSSKNSSQPGGFSGASHTGGDGVGGGVFLAHLSFVGGVFGGGRFGYEKNDTESM